MSTSDQTRAVIAHHLAAFGRGVDAVLEDYTEDSVLMTPDATVRGLDALRAFFTVFLDGLPPEFWTSFRMVREEYDGELAYIVWRSGGFAPLGTDTFVVRNGKIVQQTFAAVMTR